MVHNRDRTSSADGGPSSAVGPAGGDNLTPSDVRPWLQSNHPKQLALLDRFEIELRLGRLSTSSTAVARTSASALSADPNSAPTGRSYPADAAAGGQDGGAPASAAGALRDRRLVTVRTLELLRTLIGSTRWRTGAQLMSLLEGLGRELHAAGGYREPAIGNVVRRVMCAARDEVTAAGAAGAEEDGEGGDGKKNEGGDGMGPIDELSDSFAAQAGLSQNRGGGGGGGGGGGSLSLASMLWAHPQHVANHSKPRQVRRGSGSGAPTSSGRSLRSDSFSSVGSDGGYTATAGGGTDDDGGGALPYPPIFYASRPDLRQAVMEAIQEIMSDLEDLHKNINDQATSHIHAGEVILTYARSKTVELFLRAAAAKKRKFQVVVCEGAPHFGGHAMAKSLAAAGIDTVVVNDAATFAVMARVNKVLLPAHAVLANGGLIAPSGSNMVALAAKQNSVPVVTITGMFKLCPMYPHEGQDTLNDLVSPSSVVDYAEMSDAVTSGVEFVNPVHDYIPPQLVNLYVTNIGAFQPSYIYRLLAEYYHSDDWDSFE